jgi:hypothetical protein
MVSFCAGMKQLTDLEFFCTYKNGNNRFFVLSSSTVLNKNGFSCADLIPMELFVKFELAR